MHSPRCRRLVHRLVADRAGLEIGGPSTLFRKQLPVYSAIGRLDNVNFSHSTVWEGTIEEGETFVFDPERGPGRQYVLEATQLAPIGEGMYDVVLSSHTLEHSANPLRALAEWSRVLRLGGTLVLVLPHKEGTFDHRRPVTLLEHLVDDHERGTTEDDLTHLDEILELHDLALDPPAGSAENFAARSRQNAANRCLHHHVFDTKLALAMIDRAGFELLAVEPMLPFHIVLVARRLRQPPNNAQFMRLDAGWRRNSPFRLDRGR
jgi:SAM-dependent methyltransferase